MSNDMLKQFVTLGLGLILLFGFSDLNAQGHKSSKKKGKKEAKINELRKAYLTDKLMLSEAEQQAFWPVFDEYKLQDKTLRDSFQKKYNKNEVIFMDDKKAEEYLSALILLRGEQLKLYKEYINKVKKILPIKKVAMLPTLERAFKEEILEKAVHIKKKRQ